MILFAFLYIFIFFLFYMYGWITQLRVSSTIVFSSFIFFALAYGLIGYNIIPPVGWDLHRHYELLDVARKHGIEFIFFDSLYKGQLGSALLFSIIALLPSNQFLPFLTIFIEYVILGYIVTDYASRKGLGVRDIFIALIFHLTLCNIAWVLSTIRQPFALSIVSLAVYLDLERKKKISIVFYILSVLIHPSCLGVFLLILLFHIFRKNTFIPFLLLGWSYFSNQIGSILISTNIRFLSYIGSMLIGYVNYTQGSYEDNRPVIMNLIILLSFAGLIINELYKKKNKDMSLRFLLWSIAFTIGCFASQQIFMRYCMFISFIPYSILNCFSINRKTKYVVKKLDLFLLFFFFGMFLFQLVQATSHGAVLN